jgi:hypothetical protein
LLLTRDILRRTDWYGAAENGGLEVLHKLFNLAKQVLIPQHLSENIFLAKDNAGRFAWNMSVDQGNLDILHKRGSGLIRY